MSVITSAQMPPSSTISTHDSGIFLTTGPLNGTSTFSGLSPVANRAYYIPVPVTQVITINKLWVVNGGTVSGNFDIGIYTTDGTKVVSTGSTAMTGTNTVQSVSITQTDLGPGSYYFAIVHDNTTARPDGITFNANVSHLSGCFYQDTAFPLPATATFTSGLAVNGIIMGALINPITVI